MSKNSKKNICLNYHNLGYGFQVGVNRVNPVIFYNHIKVLEDILSKNSDINISVTFDDGYENIYKYAQPLLNKSTIKDKKVFIITDYIGKKNEWDFSFHFNRYNHLNKDQIRKLYADGWEIGSHGLSHKSFMEMNKNDAKNEIVSSKKNIEDIIGEEVKSIAPPFSAINQDIYDICAEAGYNSIYIQKEVSVYPIDGVDICYRNNIYSIDKNDNIRKKINLDTLEKKKENFISSFNNLTILLSRFLLKSSI